jgi:hypothetical protein
MDVDLVCDLEASQVSSFVTSFGADYYVSRSAAEDSIVSRLEWFRLTDETSERQWDDVEKLVGVHGDSLDVQHMRRMAGSIGVGDLLEKVLAKH